MKLVDHGEPTSFLDPVFLVWTQRECKSNESINEEYRKMFESRILRQSNGKVTRSEEIPREHDRVVIYTKTIAWSHDMEGYSQKCSERHCELANKKVEQL